MISWCPKNCKGHSCLTKNCPLYAQQFRNYPKEDKDPARPSEKINTKGIE